MSSRFSKANVKLLPWYFHSNGHGQAWFIEKKKLNEAREAICYPPLQFSLDLADRFKVKVVLYFSFRHHFNTGVVSKILLSRRVIHLTKTLVTHTSLLITLTRSELARSEMPERERIDQFIQRKHISIQRWWKSTERVRIWRHPCPKRYAGRFKTDSVPWRQTPNNCGRVF